jgi:8-oxo-dGTP pyrophosphatase MutT (NUDIX family)
MPEARAAATVLLLRDGKGGIEVFMVQRHRRSGFLPNAWVFPGGRVDPGDHLHGHPRVRGGEALARAFGLSLEETVAHAIAGVRETFEEAGLWLGTGELPESLRPRLNAGEVSLAEALDAHDAHLDLDALGAWSWWVTPKVEPKRYDTRFLMAAAPGGAGRHDELETVDSRWIPARAVPEGLPLAPPTWWTLRELADHDTVAQAMRTERPAGRPIRPVMQFEDTGIRLLLPGHVDHDEPEVPGVCDAITWEGASWVAWRGGERVTDLRRSDRRPSPRETREP